MKSILDELYYGNIRPLEIKSKETKSINNDAFVNFENNLSKNDFEAFHEAINCIIDSNSITNKETFKYGFKLGFQLALELIETSKKE